MNLAKSIRISIALALALTMSVSGVAYAAAPTINANAAGRIEGSGATFPVNQYTRWFSRFTAVNKETTPVTTGTSTKQFSSSDSGNSLVLSYTGVGSSTGIANFFGANRRKPTQMFSGTDALLSSANRTSIQGTDIGTKYSVIPAITGPISAAYNVPGLKASSGAATLKLDGEALCGIYMGTIKKWNDAKISALNPTITNLPNANIVVVGRSEGSGTTYIFASYLAKSSTDAQKKCGYHSNFSSGEANLNDAAGTINPVTTAPGTYFSNLRTTNGASAIVGQSGNAGVAGHVKATANSIGYVESSYVSSYKLQEAVLAAKTLSAGKVVYLKPTTATVKSALDNAVASEDPINPSTSYIQPVFATGANSYPIVGYSWLIIYHEYTNANGLTKGQVQGMIAFLNWALTTGQTSAELYAGYNPLPAAAATTAIAELKKIKFDGELLWP